MILSSEEVALLRAVRVADEEEGGLLYENLSNEEREVLSGLVGRGLVEYLGGYGEAPDGEEDERDAGGVEGVYRIAALGVEALHDLPP